MVLLTQINWGMHALARIKVLLVSIIIAYLGFKFSMVGKTN